MESPYNIVAGKNKILLNWPSKIVIAQLQPLNGRNFLHLKQFTSIPNAKAITKKKWVKGEKLPLKKKKGGGGKKEVGGADWCLGPPPTLQGQEASPLLMVTGLQSLKLKHLLV